MQNQYFNNGVIVNPSSLVEGDRAQIIYKGLLFSSGADSVYLRTGFGCEWNNVIDIKMSKTAEGFEATVPVTSRESLNLAFKDSASNWDNNYGSNYTFVIDRK